MAETLEHRTDLLQSHPELAVSTVDQAIELMKERGAAYVPAFATPEECDSITEQLDIPLDEFGTTGWHDFLQQTDLVEGRQKARPEFSRGTPVIQALKRKIVDSVRKSSKKQPEIREWVNRTGEDPNALPIVDIFKYQDGSALAKHIDVDNGDFPTQALVTLRGTAIFDVFELITDEEPKYSISLSKGDLVFLRGNEFGKLKQPPHAVRDNDGDRVVMILYPSQDYESEMRWSKSRGRSPRQPHRLLKKLSNVALSKVVRR